MAEDTGPGAGSSRAGATREKLMRAAERVFAEQSVAGAQMLDIVRLAGQRNPSAVQYHFGSRKGLLDAVMAVRQERTERVLASLLDTVGGDLRELVAVLVVAEASELASDSGRYCLRISGQLSHTSGVREGVPAPVLSGSAYWRLFERMRGLLGGLPEPVRLERLDLALAMVGGALAERARQYLDGEQPLTGEEPFLADLVETCAALLEAPHPAPGTRRAVSELRRSIP